MSEILTVTKERKSKILTFTNQSKTVKLDLNSNNGVAQGGVIKHKTDLLFNPIHVSLTPIYSVYTVSNYTALETSGYHKL